MNIPTKEYSVFKVQRALNGPENRVLIYNKDQSMMWEGEAPQQLIDFVFKENEYKVFAKGYHDHLTNLIFIDEVIPGNLGW